VQKPESLPRHAPSHFEASQSPFGKHNVFKLFVHVFTASMGDLCVRRNTMIAPAAVRKHSDRLRLGSAASHSHLPLKDCLAGTNTLCLSMLYLKGVCGQAIDNSSLPNARSPDSDDLEAIIRRHLEQFLLIANPVPATIATPDSP
jgi:hypothetical protein